MTVVAGLEGLGLVPLEGPNAGDGDVILSAVGQDITIQ